MKDLGHGIYGIVYLCWDLHNNALVALKSQNTLNSSFDKKFYFNEVLALTEISKIKCDNLVKFLENFETFDECCIVTEYCNGGNLERLMA